MDKQWNKDELTFVDSWKDKNVELAAGTALIVGAGLYGAKGKFPDVAKYGQQAVKQTGKAFDRYVKKNSHPVIRQGYNVGAGIYKNLKNAKLPSQEEVFEEFMSSNINRVKNIDEKELSKRFADEFAKKNNLYNARVAEAKALGKDVSGFKEPDPILIKEQVRQDMIEADLKPVYTAQKREKPEPLFSKREVASNIAGSGISAIGFGAGLTMFHAANNALTGKDKERDKAFEAAGSYLSRKEKEERRMNKQAGAKEVYDSLAGVGANIPKAIASGIGFTGVSLGSAHLLNKNKQEESNKNRIIIELGEEDPMNKSNSSHATAGGLSLLPRQEFQKSAAFKSFLKNLGGRSAETNALKNKMEYGDYKLDAASSFPPEQVQDIADKQFGHFLTPDKAKEQLLDSEAIRLKSNDQKAQEAIQEEVAKARLATGAGLGIAGLAGGGFYHSRKKEGNQNEQTFV